MISTILLYVILGIIALITITVVILIIIEHNGGYLGDSSLIPGCLFWATVILTAIIAFGFWTGRIMLK